MSVEPPPKRSVSFTVPARWPGLWVPANAIGVTGSGTCRRNGLTGKKDQIHKTRLIQQRSLFKVPVGASAIYSETTVLPANLEEISKRAPQHSVRLYDLDLP